jgi:hypothetical protein
MDIQGILQIVKNAFNSEISSTVGYSPMGDYSEITGVEEFYSEIERKLNGLPTIFEIQSFGDFDIKITECIMVHHEKMDKNEILNEFYKINNITSNIGLNENLLRTITKDFIVFLELKGFRKLVTESIIFTD